MPKLTQTKKARDARILALRRDGKTWPELARRFRLNERTVARAAERAEIAERAQHGA